MIEIKQAYKILRNRWPEVALLLGLDILAQIIVKTMVSGDGEQLAQSNFIFLNSLILLAFAIISSLLRLGFLRTVYLEGEKPQLPITLLKTGKHFLGRMVGLALIYGVFLLLVIHFGRTLIGTGDQRILLAAFNLIFMKFIILLPAFIIVFDCKIAESLKLFKNYRFINAKPIIVLFCIQTVPVLFKGSFLAGHGDAIIAQYILMAVPLAVGQIISLAIAIMAIKFVASDDLVYDADSEQFDTSTEE